MLHYSAYILQQMFHANQCEAGSWSGEDGMGPESGAAAGTATGAAVSAALGTARAGIPDLPKSNIIFQ
jgi:hypothetical protein